MRIAAFIESCAFALGIVGIAAGNVFDMPKGVELGVFVIGVGFALAGLEGIITRQLALRLSDYGWDDWMGAPAVIVGLMQLLIGIAVIASAYALGSGRWPELINVLANRPGPMLAAMGFVVFGIGLVIFIVADRYGSKLRFIFVGLPRITIGVLSLILGIAMIGAGAWEWVHHPSFERFANSTASKLNLPSPTQVWRDTIVTLK